ncbi:MAG: hypothetical protein KC586_30340, partial [Myxococcales bacterium]|nr:hypothetical protein [Myxococcales bacterium]
MTTPEWQTRPLTAFRTTREELVAQFGPPTFENEDSNGLGAMDVWVVRFACGLEASLLLMKGLGSDGVHGGENEPGDRHVEVWASDTERSHLLHHLGGRDGSPFSPDRTYDGVASFVVRRIDDNGNVFDVERFTHRCG